jgi:hypothetical protein
LEYGSSVGTNVAVETHILVGWTMVETHILVGWTIYWLEWRFPVQLESDCQSLGDIYDWETQAL